MDRIANPFASGAGTPLGFVRKELMHKGMVYSPQHGETAFTVPMFDAFMKRRMPGWVAPTAE